MVAAWRRAKVMAAPIVHHILPAAVFHRQAIAAVPRMVRSGAAVVAAVVTAIIATVVVTHIAHIMHIAAVVVTVVVMGIAVAAIVIVIVGECESAGEQR